jgi:preflagellin peptidase FlaK
LQEAALLALGLALTAAAWQDVKTREIDVGIFAAAGAAAAVLMWLNWGNPLYTLSLAVGALLALLTRLSGAGYADSTALALISTAPPAALLPAPFTAVAAGSVLLPATMLWLYAKNRGRPCKIKDLEKYDPPMIKGWVKAKCELPYVFHLAAGFWIYMALFLTTP